MTADVAPLTSQPAKGDAKWCSWTRRDITLGLALILVWRLLPLLKPSPLSVLPATAQGAILLFGPQLSYFIFPLVIVYLRRGGLACRFPDLRVMVRESLVSIGVLTLFVSAILGVATTISLVSPDTNLIPTTYVRRAAQLGHSNLVWVLLASTILMAPLCEETFFRGFLQQAFRLRMSLIAASLVQSAFFAFMHGLDALLTPASLVVGLVLTALCEWRRTLIAPITFHMGLNVACSILFVLVVESHNSRPMLGIAAYENAGPCRVRLVVPGSAAAQAGIKKEDVITAFDGDQVEDFPHLLQLIAKHDIRDVVGVSVLRGGGSIELQVILQPPTTTSQ